MRTLRCLSSAAIACLCFSVAAAAGQTPGQSAADPTHPAPPRASASSSAAGNEIPADQIDSTLAGIAAKYFSFQSSGLSGFKCGVRPDWRNYLSSDQNMPDDLPQLQVLRAEKLTYLFQVEQKSTVEFKPPEGPLPKLTKGQLEENYKAHSYASSMLQSTMEQIWRKFTDLTVLALDTKHARVTMVHTSDGYRLDRFTNIVHLVENFDNEFVLTWFADEFSDHRRVTTTKYEPCPMGLLLREMHASNEPVGNSSAPPDRFDVTFEYQTVDGYPVPSNARFEMPGKHTYAFEFYDCQVNPHSK